MRWKMFMAVLIIIFVAATAVLTACQPDSQPAILYLNWDEQGRIQLFQTKIADGAPQQLTHATTDILHYAPSPDGEKIIYSTGAKLWLVGENTPLLTCPHPPCDQLVWHPDGRRLLYEQQNQLWWLDVTTGETLPLKLDAASPSRAARFSADGEWVSYVVSPDQGIEFYNFTDGRHFQITSILGTPAVWHPSEATFLYRDQRLVTLHSSDDDAHQEHDHAYASANVLYLATVTNPTGMLVSGDGVVDDGSPAWSPDGQWILFGRQPPRVAAGQQLWLARPDGREAQALTHEPLIHHGTPQWSEDGRFILYQRYDTTQANSKPAIWLIEIATGEQTPLSGIGFLPSWLP